MPTERDIREAKLPVWARDLLASHRNEIGALRDQVAAYEHEVGKTRVWHGDYARRVYVPEAYPGSIFSSQVHFDLSGKDEFRYDVQVRVKDDTLEVIAGAPVQLELGGANLIYVRIKP